MRSPKRSRTCWPENSLLSRANECAPAAGPLEGRRGQARVPLAPASGVLLEIGDDIGDVGVILQARKRHLCALHDGFGALQIFRELGVVPNQTSLARLRHRGGIFEALMSTGRPAYDALQRRSDLVLV